VAAQLARLARPARRIVSVTTRTAFPLFGLLLIGLLSQPLLARQVRTQEPLPDLASLYAQVKDNEDRVNGRVFTLMVAHKNLAAFKTLRKSLPLLRNEYRLNFAYRAFAGFAGQPELAQKSVAFLHGEAKSHNRDENQRAAARGLVAFGELAFDELELLLARHREEPIKRIAAQPLIPRLGEIGTPRAAETILEYAELAGGQGEQIIYRALVQCEGRKADNLYAQRLLNRDTPERWRLLLLSVLAGREGRATLKPLIGTLDDPSAAVRTLGLQVLGERRERGAIKKVRRRLTTEDPGELLQTIVTLGQLLGGDEDWQAELLELARDRRPAARLGAAAALLELRTPPAVEALHRLLADGDWRVRVEALQQIANLHRATSVPILIERLGLERGRLRRDVALVLRLMTGQDHGTSEPRWRGWWENEGAAFSLPEPKQALAAERERASRRRTNQTTATFYGLEVVSERVAFVLDTSGSMAIKAGSRGRTSTQDGKDTGATRIEVAKQELTSALKHISPGVLFNLIFLTSGVSPWQDELVVKDEEVLAEALEFVERQTARGGTNIYDALVTALEDPRVDTVYLLSDGDPSAGQVIEPMLILERIGKLNRSRKVQIHTISIGKESAFMQALAAQNGGVYKVSL
jgi:HEAT repeat protein